MDPHAPDDLAGFNGKKVLVFGGDGFIGSNFIRNLFAASPQVSVINVDARTYSGNPHNLADIRERHQASGHDTGQLVELHGSIADPELVAAAFRSSPDYVINFAAETHVDRSIHVGSKEFVDTNVTGVMNILEEVKKHPEVKKFVQVSTDEVYGQLPNPYDRKTKESIWHDAYGKGEWSEYAKAQKFNRASPFKPNVPYSATKAAGDCLCNAYHHTWGVPVVVTHCSNNYGPYQYPEKLIPFWATRLLAGKRIPMYGDGLNIRDWIHVDDHITALAAVLLRGEPGKDYLIGADNERTNIDMATLIIGIMKPGILPHPGILSKEVRRDYIEDVADRPGHDRRYAIDHSDITRELGWTPKYGADAFEAKLTETLEWYRAHTEWMEEVIQRTGVANPHIDLWKAHNVQHGEPGQA